MKKSPAHSKTGLTKSCSLMAKSLAKAVCEVVSDTECGSFITATAK